MKRFVFLLVGVVLVCALWSGGWIYASGYIRGEVEKLALADGQTAPKVTCGGLNIGGFPFRFDLECTQASIVSADTQIDIAAVRASILVYRPNHVIASALSPATVADAFTGSRQQLDWEGLQASLRTDWFKLARVSLVTDGLKVSDALFGMAPVVQAAHLEAHLVDLPEEAEPPHANLALYVNATDLDAPSQAVSGGQVQIEAHLNKLPDDIRQLAAPNLLADWQAAGGTLEIVDVAASDANATLSARGELALDDGAALNGTLAVTSTGLAERFGTMIEEPWRTITLGSQAPDGSYTQNLTLRRGVILAGILPVAVIPPLY